MSPLPVFNRSFGGSTTSDILYFTDKIITPYKPKIIVYYAGSNDINLNYSADEILKNFQDFSEKISQDLPGTKIIFLSINKAPQKESKWEIVDQANKKIKSFCDNKSGRIYLDINPLLFNNDGSCKKELFYSDNLHFKPIVYEDLAKVVKPLLESEWKKQLEI